MPPMREPISQSTRKTTIGTTPRQKSSPDDERHLARHDQPVVIQRFLLAGGEGLQRLLVHRLVGLSMSSRKRLDVSTL